MDRYSSDHPFRIGTRASPLAMAQANMVRTALITAHGWSDDMVVLAPMVASGDRILDRALADVGGKALWTRELDAALADGSIDASVHSMKDVETERPPEFAIFAMLERADVRDRLVGAISIDALRQGACIGTSSPRRSAQLRRLRPDLTLTLLRGNVGTRLGKIDSGEIEATLLAAAGLDRLDMAGTGHAIAVETMLPAPQQGAIGIEARSDDNDASRAIAAISHAPTMRAVLCERAFLRKLGGDCRSPVAALARIAADGALTLSAQILASDGSEAVDDRWTGQAGTGSQTDDAAGAAALAERMMAAAPDSIRTLFTP